MKSIAPSWRGATVALAAILGRCASGLVVAAVPPGLSFAPPYNVEAPRYQTFRAGALAVADFDGDGRIDAAVAGTYVGGIAMLFNDPSGQALRVWIPVGGWPTALAAADLDGDGDVDLAVAHRDGGGVTILDNPGDGHLVPVTFTPTGKGPHAVAAVDLNGDGVLELLVANRFDETVEVLVRAARDYLVLQSIPVSGEPAGLAVADLDGDGDADVAVVCPAEDAVKILANQSGSLVPAGVFEGGAYPVALAAGDLDKDGDIDLAATNQEGGQITLLLNDGAGQLQARPTSLGIAGASRDLLIRDFDYDGNPDIAWGGVILLGDGQLGFAPVEYVSSFGTYAQWKLTQYPYPFWGLLSPGAYGRDFLVNVLYQRPAPDINGDGVVDIADVVRVVSAFGASRGMVGYDPYADLNANGIVDVFDVIEVVTHFGTTYQP